MSVGKTAGASAALVLTLSSCAFGAGDNELEVLVDGESKGTLSCTPPAGTVRFPRFACAFLGERPELFTEDSSLVNSCPPGVPVVSVHGKYAGREVDLTFDQCADASAARWADLLFSGEAPGWLSVHVFKVGEYVGSIRCDPPRGSVLEERRICHALSTEPELLQHVGDAVMNPCSATALAVFVRGQYRRRDVDATFSVCDEEQAPIARRWKQLIRYDVDR